MTGQQTSVDGSDVFGPQFLYPPGVIESLRYNFTRGSVPFHFDQNKRAIGGDCQQVNPSTEAGIFLSSNQHPFIREKAWGSDNHRFQQLLFGK
jgi:hypothetical protein